MAVEVRFLAGDCVVLNDCHTVDEVMARIAIRSGRFASDVLVLDQTATPIADLRTLRSRIRIRDFGFATERSNSPTLPPLVSVLFVPENDERFCDDTYDTGRIELELNLYLHAEHADIEGCKRLVEMCDRYSGSHFERDIEPKWVPWVSSYEQFEWDSATIAEKLFFVAASAGKTNIFDSLLQAGVRGWYALHRAASLENLPLLNKLISVGIPVDIVNFSGSTALLQAVRHIEVTRFLLAAKANIEHKDAQNNTALMCACKVAAGVEVMELLLSLGQDVNCTNIFGQTPLISACEWRVDSGVIKLLLSAQADANVTDESGCTALDTMVKTIYRYDGYDDVFALLHAAEA